MRAENITRLSEPAVQLRKFTGLNNKAEPLLMVPGELTQADNIDIDDRFGVRRRRDSRRDVPMTALTSAWATPDEERMFVVEAGNLLEIVSENGDTVQLASGLDGLETYWATDGERVFVSNNAVDIVVERDVAYPLAVPSLESMVDVSVVGGDLPAGRYLVAAVLEDSRGRQGPASAITSVVLGDSSGMALSSSAVPAGYEVRYFASGTNDDTLYSVGNEVRSADDHGPAMEQAQYFGHQPVMGGPIAWHAGRLVKGIDAMGDGTGYVALSEPYWPHLFTYGNYDFQVPGKVTALADVQHSALLVGTTRRVFRHHLDEGLLQVADYGIPNGHPVAVDDNGLVYFWTQRGMCRAFPFENLTDAAVAVPVARRCSVGIVKHGGFERVVAVTKQRLGEKSYNPR